MKRCAKKILFLTVLFLMGTFSLVTAQAGVKYGGTLTFVIGVPPVTLAPGKSVASIVNTIRAAIYETLVDRDLEGNFVPGLATSWEVSEDGTEWTFHLRRDVKFHSGKMLSAEDVKATFDRLLNPSYALPLSKIFRVIKSVQIIDDYTVKFVTEKPVADMLARMAYAHAEIIGKEAVEKYGADLDWVEDGTGPYKLESYVPEESVTLVRFNDYWGGKPYLDKIVFKVVREDATRVAMLETGQADVVVNVPAADVPRLQANPNIEIHIEPSSRVAHIGLNCQKPPFNDVRVRQALNYAIDREAIIKGILKGVGKPAYSIVSPIVWGYYKVEKYYYDPQKAKKLLAAAGYPNGFKATLWTPQGRYFMDKETAVAVQAQLREVGVDVDVRVIDWATYLSLLRKPLEESRTEMYLLGWESGTGDIAYILDLVFDSAAWPPESWNTMFYKDTAVDVLIDAGKVTTDLKDRHEIYKGLQKLVVDDAPWIFLYVYQMVTGMRSNVHGLRLLPTEVFTIKKVWKE